MPTHKQKVVAIKTVPIDEAIIAIVTYLNSHERVHTLYSCQGRGTQFDSGGISLCIYEPRKEHMLREMFQPYARLKALPLQHIPHALYLAFYSVDDRDHAEEMCAMSLASMTLPL